MEQIREYNTYNACRNGEELPMGYTTNKCVLRFMYLYKVDYMMANTFIYATVTLKLQQGHAHRTQII